MNPPLRLALCAVLLSLSGLGSACGPTGPELPGAPLDTPATSCQVDQDCPDPGLFFCDTVTSRCSAACRTQEDCTAAKRGEHRIAECDGNPLGCRCDTSRCRVAQCSADAECAASGQVCRNGRCGTAPEASTVTACRVTPDFVVGREGTLVRFSVLAMDAAGKAVVVPSGATWAALDESVAVEGASSGAESSFVLSAATEGARESVQARMGGATCTARVSVLRAAVVSGQLRAVVRDELTGRPIEGAVVVAADAQGAETARATTDGRGVAMLAAPAEAGSVSVFHQDFGYLTVAHEGAGGPRDLALPLRRNPTDRYGGYKGTFRNMPVSLDMHTGLAGLSAPDAVTDVSASLVAGPVRRVAFTMGGQAREATLPAGAYVVLPDSTLQVTDVSAQGLAGVCGTEEAVTAGACGVRTAWALGGDIPLNALPLLSGGTMDVGQLLAQTIPLLRTFSSSVVRDVEFRLEVTPRDEDTGVPDYRDQKHLAVVDHDFKADQRMELGFQFAVRVPALPRYRGTWMDSAAVLGAVRVPGRGVVPLGLGMGVNTNPVNDYTDTQAGLPGQGLVSVRMAPAHHGLEGSPYELMITASSSAASSALIHRTLERLPFDPKGGTPVVVSGPFLPVPEGAHYNYNPVAIPGLAGRQLRFAPAPVFPNPAEPPVLRAVFTNRVEHRWVVLLDAARAETGVRLPVPPVGFEDRTYYGDLEGSRSPLAIHALAVRRTGTSAGAAMNLHGLVDADGVDLEHLGALTVAWSALDHGRALVTWVEPAEDGQSVARGSKVKVRVSAFRVGSGTVDTDGYVRLTFAGGAGCEGEVKEGTVADAQGQVELPLPAGCTGTGVTLTATLMEPKDPETQGSKPVSPPVMSTRTLTIN